MCVAVVWVWYVLRGVWASQCCNSVSTLVFFFFLYMVCSFATKQKKQKQKHAHARTRTHRTHLKYYVDYDSHHAHITPYT